MKIREAMIEDCKFTWELTNDPVVRSVSFSSAPIPWEDHQKWFRSRINDKNTLFFIGEDDCGAPIGQCRFSLSDKIAEISVSISPDFRGKGLGSKFISESVNELFRTTDSTTVDAYIKEDNPASIKAFEKAGFVKSDHEETKNGIKALLFIIEKK